MYSSEMYHSMGMQPCFSAIFTKGTYFHDFLFASLYDSVLLKELDSWGAFGLVHKHTCHVFLKAFAHCFEILFHISIFNLLLDSSAPDKKQ